MIPVSFLDPRNDPSLFPGLGTGSFTSAVQTPRCHKLIKGSALQQGHLSGVPRVCVSLVPREAPARAVPGRAETPQQSGFRGKPPAPRPRLPSSPSRPCPRYLRGGGRRPPLVERGGRPCARVERRAEAGGGQAGGPVRVLHPGARAASAGKRAGSPGRRAGSAGCSGGERRATFCHVIPNLAPALAAPRQTRASPQSPPLAAAPQPPPPQPWARDATTSA